jgi:hypothetical protein
MPGFETRQVVRRGLGALLVLGACCALHEAHAERTVRGARCSGELAGEALRGAIRLEHLAERGFEAMSGHFNGNGNGRRLELEVLLQDGVGNGRLWEAAPSGRAWPIDVQLRGSELSLRTHGGARGRFACEGL